MMQGCWRECAPGRYLLGSHLRNTAGGGGAVRELLGAAHVSVPQLSLMPLLPHSQSPSDLPPLPESIALYFLFCGGSGRGHR